VRSPSNSEGRAGDGPRALEITETEDTGGFAELGMCISEGVSQVMRRSSLCWVSASLACISERACSRTAIHSASMVCEESSAGDMVLESAEEGSWAEEYTESVESDVELRNTTMVG